MLPSASASQGTAASTALFVRDHVSGLNVIYLQAKRWEGTVGRPEIQKFVGALQGHHASRGVFITASSSRRKPAIMQRESNGAAS